MDRRWLEYSLVGSDANVQRFITTLLFYNISDVYLHVGNEDFQGANLLKRFKRTL